MKNIRLTLFIPLLMLLAGMLSACDPSCYSYLVVDGVGILDQKPALHVSERVSWGVGCGIVKPERHYVSPDAGASWRELTAPRDPLTELGAPVSNKLTACAEDDPKLCYRINGYPQVEISTDGGNSWRVDWQMPAGRQNFMIRQPAIEDLVGVEPDLIPYDLAILSTDTEPVVLVAYGNQGVLVKSERGDWSRYPVYTSTDGVRPAAPIPYKAIGFDGAWQALFSETTWIFLMAFCYFMLCSMLSWLSLLKRIPHQKPSYKGWLTVGSITFILLLGLLVWVFIATHGSGAPGDWQGVDSLLAYVCFVPVILVSVLLLILGLSLPKNRAIWLVSLLGVVLAIGFFGSTWLAFALWAWGILPHYWQAMIAAGVLGLFFLIFGFLAEKRLVRYWRTGPGN